MKRSIKKESRNVSKRSGSFLDETKAELARIEWPIKDLVVKASVLILIIMCFSTLYIAGIDVVFSKLFIKIKGF